MPKWSPLEPETDRRLVLGLNEGAEDVLAALYDAYAERLYDYCLSMVREAKPAADIVHDVFVDASRRAPRMRDRLALRAWLYGAVRRRCLQLARGAKPRGGMAQKRGPGWKWGFEPDSGQPVQPELQAVLAGAMKRLAIADQEVAVLVIRHGLTGADLAVVLGVSPCRANVRLRQGRVRAAMAVADEVTDRCLDCVETAESDTAELAAIGLETVEAVEAAGVGGRDGADGGVTVKDVEARDRDLDLVLGRQVGDELSKHVDDCADCQARWGIDPEALLTAPPAAVLPSSLRRRVLHTGSDPELAAYRADIAARGGGLTADGMPLQPDVTSPIARRWLFTGGAAVGALVAALVAALFIGTNLPGSNFFFPYDSRPGEGDITAGPMAGAPSGHPGRPAGPRAGPKRSLPGQIPIPKPEGDVVTSTPPSLEPGQILPLPGDLSVSQTQVRLVAPERTAVVQLTASGGPVSWTASASSPQVQLSSGQGTIPKNGVHKLTITLQPMLVQLPGEARILITDGMGRQQIVTLIWTFALL